MQQQQQQQQQQQDQQQVKMVLVVAVALIDQQQRVLLAQRPQGKAMAGLWEFPGGKVGPVIIPVQQQIQYKVATAADAAGTVAVESEGLCCCC
jgi:adenine-specific DNA glycosylase